MYVLLVSYCDYRQHGEYFCAAFNEKPTKEQLVKDFYIQESCAGILLDKGECEQSKEWKWYSLREIFCDINYENKDF